MAEQSSLGSPPAEVGAGPDEVGTGGDDAPIVVRGLSKSFGSTRAVDQLDMRVRRGTTHGFLGPNGAGKSTTIRAILGMLRPDSGSIRINGVNPLTDPARATARVSYVPGDVTLWPQLTGAQTLTTLARIRGDSSAQVARRRAELIERFELDPGKKVRTYSKGNRQKVALIAALAAEVDIFVLDEPTSGLDPLMEREFAQCIREANERGISVLLSSHILSEVENLAHDVTIIRAGKLVQSGTLEELSALRGSHITARLIDGELIDEMVGAEQVNARLAQLANAGARDITCRRATLEDIFLDHYRADSSGGRP